MLGKEYEYKELDKDFTETQRLCIRVSSDTLLYKLYCFYAVLLRKLLLISADLRGYVYAVTRLITRRG